MVNNNCEKCQIKQLWLKYQNQGLTTINLIEKSKRIVEDYFKVPIEKFKFPCVIKRNDFINIRDNLKQNLEEQIK